MNEKQRRCGDKAAFILDQIATLFSMGPDRKVVGANGIHFKHPEEAVRFHGERLRVLARAARLSDDKLAARLRAIRARLGEDAWATRYEADFTGAPKAMIRLVVEASLLEIALGKEA